MNHREINEKLDDFVNRVQTMGIEVRYELLGGMGAGLCEIDGKQCLFLDLNCSPADQLEAIRKAIFERGNSIGNQLV